MMLLQITAPHFCAGIIVTDRLRIHRAAPILAKWIGKHYDEFARHCARHAWRITVVETW